ncbi:MAG: thiamine diphosphokinase [Paracoccaceae bacterium]|nr:thiamine diphosphokinase [Paracoccaceae bacterium]
MDRLPIGFDTPVTVVGGGALDETMISEARRLAPTLIAADGGADRLANLRLMPEAVIGDMDSIADPEHWRAGPARFIHLAEQDSTDFEKCLYATEAPLYLAAGFTGGRVDHSLAAMHVLLKYPDKRVVMIGAEEVMALVPAEMPLRVTLNPGSKVSIHPLREVRATRSRGLAWPIDDLVFAPGDRSGTSNEASEPVVEMAFEGLGALVIFERAALASLAGALSESGR